MYCIYIYVYYCIVVRDAATHSKMRTHWTTANISDFDTSNTVRAAIHTYMYTYMVGRTFTNNSYIMNNNVEDYVVMDGAVS